MSVLFLIVVGVAAGFIASKVMRTELSTLETVAIGVLGAVIGGFLLRTLITVSGFVFGLVGAVLGACVLLWLYMRFVKGRF